jgi:hypothetical protein
LNPALLAGFDRSLADAILFEQPRLRNFIATLGE